MAGIRSGERTRSDAFRAAMVRLTAASRNLHDRLQAYDAVLDALQAVLPSEWAGICLVSSGEDRAQRVDVVASRGLPLDQIALGAAAGEVMASREPIVHARGDGNDRLDAFLDVHGLRHFAAAAFSPDTDRPGVIALASRDPEGIHPDDLQYVEAFAGTLSMLLTVVRTQETVQRQADDAARLLNIGSTIALAGKSDDIIAITARAIANGLDTAIAIYILSDDHIRLRAVRSPTGHNSQHVEFIASHLLQQRNNPIAETLALSGQDPAGPALRIDVAEGERFSSLRDLDCGEIVIAPLEIGGRRIGAVAAFNRLQDVIAGKRGVNLVETLPRVALYVSPAIQNSLLQQEFVSLVRENEAVRRINQVAWESATVEESVSLVARTVALLFDADLVVLVEMRDTKATWYYTHGSIVPEGRTGVLQLPNLWYRERVQHLEEIVVPELGTEPPIPASEWPLLLEEALVTFLAVPFRILGNILGTMIIGYRTKREISSGDIRFARSLTHGVAATLMIRRLQTRLDLDAGDAGDPSATSRDVSTAANDETVPFR
jgi:hypothetical protein